MFRLKDIAVKSIRVKRTVNEKMIITINLKNDIGISASLEYPFTAENDNSSVATAFSNLCRACNIEPSTGMDLNDLIGRHVDELEVSTLR